ncbi:hypothetical protein DFJ77DRAFT_462624 [Powellomyces hirtus]|nr:hypothetical protein DFJ77DRAFT_462624 [Powellomyces hirtus]
METRRAKRLKTEISKDERVVSAPKPSDTVNNITPISSSKDVKPRVLRDRDASDPVSSTSKGRGFDALLMDSDDEDADLFAPSPLSALSSRSHNVENQPSRRSARNKGHVSYAPPPMDPFADKILLAKADQERQRQNTAKRKAFSIDGLLADKRKQEKRKVEHQALEVLIKEENEEESGPTELPAAAGDFVPEEAFSPVKDLLNPMDKSSKGLPNRTIAEILELKPTSQQLWPPPISVLPDALIAIMNDRTRAIPAIRANAFTRLLSRSEEHAAPMLDWLLQIALYDDEDDLLPLSATRNIAHFMRHRPSHSWHVTKDVFVSALQCCGYPESLLSRSPVTTPLSNLLKACGEKEAGANGEGASKAHSSALVNIIELVGTSVQCRGDQYTSEELLNIAWYLFVLSLDHILQRSAVDKVGESFARICNALKSREDWEASCEDLCTSIAEFVRMGSAERYHVLRALTWATGRSCAALDLRRRLAMRFMLQEDVDMKVTSTPSVPKSLGDVVDALEHPMFTVAYYSKPRQPEDYVALSTMVKILAIAIGSADHVRCDLGAGKKIASRLRQIFGNIADPRAAFLERTEAKHELIALSTWLRFVTSDADGPSQSVLSFTKAPVPSQALPIKFEGPAVMVAEPAIKEELSVKAEDTADAVEAPPHMAVSPV